MDLTSHRELVVPDSVLAPTLEFLQERGQLGHEGFVVWGGKVVDEDTLHFTSCYVPQQTAHKTANGLLVVVDGVALFRMNRAFYERGEIAAGQVHTHPTDAYHSSTDDHFPLVTLCGALSLVVPDFARHGRASMDRWAWYRLREHGTWDLAADIGSRIHIEPEGS
ncbi:Mov34/MPN/PAD-1 family protein [Nocardioides glacieisoli]|uniref:Mov34/MPN/PAD-1 family protein n=1 Tax=Nocardioides glacieisoli TaxID=1168730 RepID=UPI0013E9BA06|nr:Mov34/MPN/PAD-1 family protein [Nocardioides glacieisoli]